MTARRERGKGQVRWYKGKASVRIPLGAPFGRRTFALASSLTTEAAADERAALLATIAAQLRAAGKLAIGLPLLERLATRETPAELATTAGALDALLQGKASARPGASTTFGELAERWTSGELARLYPDHVRTAEHDNNRGTLNKHVLPIVGPIPISAFTLDHAEEVMRRLPPTLESRRNVAQVMHRVLSLAVWPLRLIPAHPLPRGFVPPPPPRKAKSHLYPDEDRTLLGCREIPLERRLYWGFLDREGMRTDEAERLAWSDLDLQRGAVKLDKNKTDDPRAWALDPGTVRAFLACRKLRGIPEGETGLVFEPFTNKAKVFRSDLEKAGITRPELFERSKARSRIRAHDLRATFITIALANGRTEAWITDRTGHRSSAMIATYKRAARTVEELALGPLAPLDVALPELAGAADDGGAGGAGSPGDGSAHGEGTGAPPAPGDGAPRAVGRVAGLPRGGARPDADRAHLGPKESSEAVNQAIGEHLESTFSKGSPGVVFGACPSSPGGPEPATLEGGSRGGARLPDGTHAFE